MRKLSLHSIPALGAATLFACGIVAGKELHLPISTWLLIALTCFLAALLIPLLKNRFPPWLRWQAILLSFLATSLGATHFALDISPDGKLPDELLRKPVTVRGIVFDPYPSSGNRSRFLFQADELIAADGESVAVSAKILVTVVRQRRDSIAQEFLYGERIQLSGMLSRPPAERNPGEFNSRAYYEAQGIGYLMRVRGYTQAHMLDGNVLVSPFDWLMRFVVLPLRSYILSLIDSTVGGEEGELLKGILIGDRSGLCFATRTAFVNSGIAHILAVSGSNVAFVYGCCAMLFSVLRIPRRTAMILSAFMLMFYMLLTGNQPPIVRATAMALVLLMARLSGGRTNALNALGFAALLILLVDARQLFDVGFQLSFAAVIAILYFYPPMNALILRLAGKALWKRTVVPALRISAVTLAATLGTLPLTAIYFGKVSVVGLLTNIVVLPLVGASVSLGFVLVLFGAWAMPIAETFASANRVLLWVILMTAHEAADVSWAFIETLRFKPVHAVPFYLALLWLVHLPIRKVSRVLFVFLVGSLNLFLVVPQGVLETPLADRLRVSFIDVGQGDAALVEFPGGRAMLIDAGMWSEEYDAGERIVTPFLKRRGITKLDWFVASHPHADHIGGAPHVFQSVDVKNVIESGQAASDPVYQRYRKAVQAERAVLRKAQAYDSSLTVAGAKVYFLYPTTDVVATLSDEHINLNNTSVVLKLHYGATSFLFMGDLEREGEAKLCSMFGEFLQADVLKVGHHGSATSSTQDLLNLVQARYAVISVGRYNTFNHPSDDVVDRLNSLGAQTLRTDEEGAIVFETDGKTIRRVGWR